MLKYFWVTHNKKGVFNGRNSKGSEGIVAEER